MSRAGGLLSRIFRGLISPRPKNARFVGEDHLGNRYYEKDRDGKGRKSSRWVEARGMDEDPTFIPDVPAEWESWLRRRRTDPPQQEELDRNYAMMLRTQQRAKELEHNEGMGSDRQSGTDSPFTETITQDSFKSKFPTYGDLELKPGQFRGRTDKNK